MWPSEFRYGALGSFHLGQQSLGMGDEDLGLRCEAHPPANRLEQAHSGLALQGGQLLGDG